MTVGQVTRFATMDIFYAHLNILQFILTRALRTSLEPRLYPNITASCLFLLVVHSLKLFHFDPQRCHQQISKRKGLTTTQWCRQQIGGNRKGPTTSDWSIAPALCHTVREPWPRQPEGNIEKKWGRLPAHKAMSPKMTARTKKTVKCLSCWVRQVIADSACREWAVGKWVRCCRRSCSHDRSKRRNLRAYKQRVYWPA